MPLLIQNIEFRLKKILLINDPYKAETDHDGEVMQCVFLHPAGVHHGVQVQGTLGPALPQVPRHPTQLRAGLALVLITVTETRTFKTFKNFRPQNYEVSFTLSYHKRRCMNLRDLTKLDKILLLKQNKNNI